MLSKRDINISLYFICKISNYHNAPSPTCMFFKQEPNNSVSNFKILQHVQYVGYLKRILQNGIVLVIQSDLNWGTWHCACVTGCTNIDQLCALHIMHAWIFTDILNLFGLFKLFCFPAQLYMCMYCATIHFAYRCKYQIEYMYMYMYFNCNADFQYFWEFYKSPKMRLI